MQASFVTAWRHDVHVLQFGAQARHRASMEHQQADTCLDKVRQAVDAIQREIRSTVPSRLLSMQQSEWDMAHVKHLKGVVVEATQQLGSALPNIYIIRFEKFKNPHTPDVEGYASKHFSEWNKDVFFRRHLSCSGKGAEGQYEFQAIEEYVKNKTLLQQQNPKMGKSLTRSKTCACSGRSAMGHCT